MDTDRASAVIYLLFDIMVAVNVVDSVTRGTTVAENIHNTTHLNIKKEATTVPNFVTLSLSSSSPPIPDNLYVNYTSGQEFENAPLDYSDWSLEWKSILNYSSLPNDDKTKAFILKYPDVFSRHLVAVQLHYCPLEPLCSHSVGVVEEYPYHTSCCASCSCLSSCTEYGNCCLDMVIDTKGKKTTEVMKDCIPMDIKTNNDVGAYGIAHCPIDFAYNEGDKCEQSYDSHDVTLVDIVPVMHSRRHTIYRNMHCALCHNIDLNELDFFFAKLNCYGNMPSEVQTDYEFIQFVLDNDCNLNFQTTHMTENCTPSISTCNITKQWAKYDPDIELACNMYSSMYQVNQVTFFKNIFCAFCNGHTDLTRSCLQSSGIYPISYPFSFSGLLSFEPPAKGNSITENKCGIGYVYHNTMVSGSE